MGLLFWEVYNLFNLFVNKWRNNDERLQIADEIYKDTIL